MNRTVGFRFTLALATLFFSTLANASWNEEPAYETLTEVSRYGDQSFYRDNSVAGGLAVCADLGGNIYQASGNQIGKYDPDGLLIWKRIQSPSIFTDSGSGQQTYYDRWETPEGSFQNIRLAATGTDPGELANCFAQKILLDGAGDVIAGFSDLKHRDRSVIAKLDGESGEVLWVARTSFPNDTDESEKYVSKILDLLVLADGSVAVLETGVGAQRHFFTRMVIYSANGDPILNELNQPTRLGKVIRSLNIWRNDGGAESRDVVGVGLAADSSGNLYYATHEGAVPGTWPTFPDPFPAPDKLIIRKLAPPYTGDPTEVVHDSGSVDHWSDLAVGPGGKIFVLGTDLSPRQTQPGEDPEFDATPVLAAFDPSTLEENVFNRKSYPSTLIYPGPLNSFGDSLTEWDSWGMEIHSTGTSVDDSLYLLSKPRDFRSYPRPILDIGWFILPASVTLPEFVAFKVNSSGEVIWGKDSLGSNIGTVCDSFVSGAGHLYFIGSGFGLTYVKYSSNGALQILANIADETGTKIPVRSRTAILPSGDLVVAQVKSYNLPYYSTELRIFENPPIGPAPQTISFFPNSQYWVVNVGDAIPLEAFSSSGLPVLYRIVSGDGEITGSILKGLSGGLLEIEAFQPGNDDDIAAAVPVKFQFFVAATKAQTISFNLPKVIRKPLGSVVPLGATATSGKPVSFYSSNPRKLKIDGKKATIRGYGSVIVTARQSGYGDYLPASVIKRVKLQRPKTKR